MFPSGPTLGPRRIKALGFSLNSHFAVPLGASATILVVPPTSIVPILTKADIGARSVQYPLQPARGIYGVEVTLRVGGIYGAVTADGGPSWNVVSVRFKTPPDMSSLGRAQRNFDRHLIAASAS